jgi:hypothetical protein
LGQKLNGLGRFDLQEPFGSPGIKAAVLFAAWCFLAQKQLLMTQL